MASAISKYKNVFNEAATIENLEHIFDILNERNEDRIVFRDFTKHIEHVGLKLDPKAMRKVYDHIASSVKKQRYITKETWTKGINIAHKQPDTHKFYTAILSGKQYDPQPLREEIEMEEIRIKLQDTKAPWMYRIECMESLCRQLTVSSMKTDKFHQLFRSYHISLTKQAKDRRSNVSRVACEVFAKIIIKWKNEFLKYSYTTIEYVFELIRQKIKIVHDSGMNVLIILLKNCGDHKEYKIMDILGSEGTTSKFVNLQKDCFDLLLLYLMQQNDKLRGKKSFWIKLLDYTKKGVNDTADVRNSALMLLAQIEIFRPKLVIDIIAGMNIHLKKRYESEYKIDVGNIQIFNFDDDDEKKTPKEIKTKNGKKSNNMKSPKGGDKNGKNGKNGKNTGSPISPRTVKKGGSKSSANFPKAPKGQFLNGFGERLCENDILFAFQFIDFKNDRKITLDEFIICCNRLNVNGNAEQLFSILDEEAVNSVNIDKFRLSVLKKNDLMMDFWYKLLSGKGLEISPMSNDLDFDDANKILLNLKNSEDERLKAMYSITRRICNTRKYENTEKFEKQFKKSLSPLLNQLKDRKNSIIREVCICFAKIFMVKGNQYRTFAIRTFENLVEIIKLQDNKTHISSKQAAATLIKYIPDRSACPLMKIISDGCCDKNFKLLRKAGFEYINYYLFRMILEFEDRNKMFWKFVNNAIKSGLTDSDPEVRDLANTGLVKLELLNKDLAEKHIKTLKKTRLDKYNIIKKEELKKIKENKYYIAPSSSAIIEIGKNRKSSDKTDKTKQFKINKRPKDDQSDDEMIRNERIKKKKESEEKKRNKEKEEKLKKEKLKKEKFEKEKKEKFEKEKKEKLEKQKIERERFRKEKEEREKIERERVEKQRLEKLEKEKFEKDKKEKEEKERKERKEKKEKEEKGKKKEFENIKNGDGNLNDNDYGFPKVHTAFIAYFEDKKVKCRNPTHLVLYAKKKRNGWSIIFQCK